MNRPPGILKTLQKLVIGLKIDRTRFDRILLPDLQFLIVLPVLPESDPRDILNQPPLVADRILEITVADDLLAVLAQHWSFSGAVGMVFMFKFG